MSQTFVGTPVRRREGEGPLEMRCATQIMAAPAALIHAREALVMHRRSSMVVLHVALREPAYPLTCVMHESDAVLCMSLSKPRGAAR